MSDVIMPGAVWTPGRNAGYAAGRSRMQFAVEHFTVGTNSHNIGLNGYFHMLFPKDGPPNAYAEIDAVTWHAGPWNPLGPGWEFERLGYDEPLTHDQVHWGGVAHRWLTDQWGIPLTHYEGPRFDPSGYRGYVNHGDIDDQRSDGVTREEFDAMVNNTPPPEPEEDDDMVSYIQHKTEDHGIYATDWVFKRGITGEEWQLAQVLAAISGKPAPKPLVVSATIWDSIPTAGTATAGAVANYTLTLTGNATPG